MFRNKVWESFQIAKPRGIDSQLTKERRDWFQGKDRERFAPGLEIPVDPATLATLIPYSTFVAQITKKDHQNGEQVHRYVRSDALVTFVASCSVRSDGLQPHSDGLQRCVASNATLRLRSEQHATES